MLFAGVNLKRSLSCSFVCEIKKEPTVSFQNDWLRWQQKTAGSISYCLPSLYCIQLLLGFVSIFKGKKPFFSTNVSLDGTRNYGYFIPVYQNGTTDQVIGMVFVGTNKARKDAIVNKILGSIMMALLVVMLLCIVTAMRMAASISKNIKNSVIMKKVSQKHT